MGAVWLDSPFADIEKIVRSELLRFGYPTLLSGVAKMAGQLFGGIDIMERSPLEGAGAIGNRHLFIAHGKQDELVPPFHGQMMSDTAKKSLKPQGSVECWQTRGKSRSMKAEKSSGMLWECSPKWKLEPADQGIFRQDPPTEALMPLK